MFAHLRYLSLISFAIVIGASLLVGGYFRVVASRDLLEGMNKKNSITLTQFFIKNVWIHNHNLMKKLSSQNVTSWQNNPEFKNFANEANRYANDMPIISFRLYTPKGEKFLSNNDEEISLRPHRWFSPGVLSERIFSSVANDNGLAAAMAGAVHTRIIPRALIKNADGSLKKAAVIETFIPIISITNDDAPPTVEAIVEIFTDTTDSWNYLFYFQVIGTLGVVFIFSLLYSVLFYSSAQAQRIIHNQDDANKALNEAKQRAEAENSKKLQFLANINHELRTPLNAIIGFSALVLDEVEGPIKNAHYKDYIRDINTSGTQLLHMINNMLEYVKAESGDLKIELRDTDIGKLLTSTLNTITTEAEKASLQLKLALPKQKLSASIDPKYTKQALKSLLSNALKFTPAGGTITLSSWIDSQTTRLVIEVKDTGIGMAHENIAKALSQFGQIDDKLNRRYEGAGVGLSLTRKLTELMGGTLEIISAEGTGTAVRMLFPSTHPQQGATDHGAA